MWRWERGREEHTPAEQASIKIKDQVPLARNIPISNQSFQMGYRFITVAEVSKDGGGGGGRKGVSCTTMP